MKRRLLIAVGAALASLAAVSADAGAADIVRTYRVGTGPACGFDSLDAAVRQALSDESTLPPGDTLRAEIRLPEGTVRERSVVIAGFDRGVLTLHGGFDPGCSDGRGGKTSLSGSLADDSATRTLRVVGQSRVRLQHLQLLDNTVSGALFLQDSALELDDVDIADNRSTGSVSGGGIQMDNAILRLRRAAFLDNDTTAAGGAIFCFARDGAPQAPDGRKARESQILVEPGADVLFAGNTADFDGGALMLFNDCVVNAAVAGTSVAFLDNHARDGGAIYLHGRERTGEAQRNVWLSSKVSFDGNTAATGRSGGHAYVGAGNIFQDTEGEWRNGRAGRGGAVFNVNDTAGAFTTFSASRFIGNRATISGGAIHAEAGLILGNFFGCDSRARPVDRYCGEFLDNVVEAGAGSADEGGAVAHFGREPLSVAHYRFRGNAARRGAAIRADALELEHTLIDANDTRDADGSVLHVDSPHDADRLAFLTVADNAPGHWLTIEDPGNVILPLIGLVVDGNARGASAPADLAGLLLDCNLVQGTASALDPRFVVDPARGPFRLGAGSPARGGCEIQTLDAARFEVAGRTDLDGVTYLREGASRVDLGAFAAAPPRALLVDGFE